MQLLEVLLEVRFTVDPLLAPTSADWSGDVFADSAVSVSVLTEVLRGRQRRWEQLSRESLFFVIDEMPLLISHASQNHAG